MVTGEVQVVILQTCLCQTYPALSLFLFIHNKLRV